MIKLITPRTVGSGRYPHRPLPPTQIGQTLLRGHRLLLANREEPPYLRLGYLGWHYKLSPSDAIGKIRIELLLGLRSTGVL